MDYNRHNPVASLIIITLVNVILLSQYGDTKCVSEARRVLKAGCENYCPENQCPEECTDCISGFYGPDCRRSCRGHCLKGRCTLLANGRAINCTDGCVLGWRGLTCNTRCKYPCLECDRYSGDCVGQCRAGFYGAGCLERCLFPCSKCAKNTGVCLNSSSVNMDLSLQQKDMPVALRQTHVNNTRTVHTSNKSHSSRDPHQHFATPTTAFSDRWTISAYFPTAIAVLSAVITFVIVSFTFIRLKATMEQKRKGFQLVNSTQTKSLIGSSCSKVMSFNEPIIIDVSYCLKNHE
ncbi:angiopoietin-1 receptor-like isoform X2 [Haliotis asinina]|uniref:angiopoietin-1 receptor-like isoform X2 n=1 Tax=Haliotis asinina TaxID=109174 RepID=UPI003531BDC5